MSTKKINQVNKKNNKKEEIVSSDSEDENSIENSSDSEDEKPVKKTIKKPVKSVQNKTKKVTPKKTTPEKFTSKKSTPKNQGSSSSSSSKDRYDEDDDEDDNDDDNNKNNLNKVFNEKVNELLLTFLKPITDYYKEEYNATETPKDIAEIIEKPLIKRGRGRNVKNKKDIPKNKICKYVISEGKPTAHRCEKEKIENSEYCESHKKIMDKKEGNAPKSDEKFPSCNLIQNKKMVVSKFPEKEKDIRDKNLFLYEKRFLVENMDKKINIICKISEFESNYIVKPLTEADKGYFKQYDDIHFKNLDYLFDTIYASYDENDIPFKRE